MRLLQEMGVGKRKDEINTAIVEPLSDRQWLNWIGSGKVCVEGGVFDEEHIREVGRRYIESNGRAYSIYSYDHDSGKVTEYINTYQCAEIWGVKKRQAAIRITRGQIPHRKLGNEYFVERELAERCRGAPRFPSSAVPTRPGIY